MKKSRPRYPFPSGLRVFWTLAGECRFETMSPGGELRDFAQGWEAAAWHEGWRPPAERVKRQSKSSRAS